MTNFAHNRMNRSNTSAFSDAPKGFKIMFRVIATFVVLIFAATITVLILTFTGNAPYSYHYEVSYGNGTYSETTSWGDDE
jgi:hypothetical protein